MNTLINKILTEWAYRVDNGMPNPKNPLHIVKLKESMEWLQIPETVIDGFVNNLTEGEEWWSKLSPEEQSAYIKAHPKSQKAKDAKKKKSDDEPRAATPADKDIEVTKNPFHPESPAHDTWEKEHGDKGPSKEQIQKEKEKQEFLLDMSSGLLETSTEESGVGRFNMSKEDLGKYKSYLKGNKPETPNYDISDDEVDEVIGVLKSTLGENYQKFVQRVRKKGDPPKQYSTGETGKKRLFSCLKHYMQTGGRSSITGEFVPFSESQLDHVTSLDNGGVDGPENWEWMESRFNQFKGALTDEDVMNKIKSDLDKSPDEDKLKTLNQSFRKYSKEAFINYYDNKFKNGGTAGLTEESINNMNGSDINALIKGWNKSHPDGSEFFVPRYGSKKDPKTGKDIDRKSGRASGGRIASKPELIKRFLEKSKGAGINIPTKSETDIIDKDFQLIVNQLDKQKGEISKLKQKIKQRKTEK